MMVVLNVGMVRVADQYEVHLGFSATRCLCG